MWYIQQAFLGKPELVSWEKQHDDPRKNQDSYMLEKIGIGDEMFVTRVALGYWEEHTSHSRSAFSHKWLCLLALIFSLFGSFPPFFLSYLLQVWTV